MLWQKFKQEGVYGIRGLKKGLHLEVEGLEDLTEKMVFEHRLEEGKRAGLQVLEEEHARPRTEQPAPTDKERCHPGSRPAAPRHRLGSSVSFSMTWINTWSTGSQDA